MFRLGDAYFDPDRFRGVSSEALLRLGAREILENDHCEDRVERPGYNTRVPLAPEELAACRAAGRCPESLLNPGVYDALIWVEHNPARTPGAGSCIFLHVEAGPEVATAGCTSTPRKHLEAVMEWLDPLREPVLLQLPRREYEARKTGWRLPDPESI